MIYSGYQFDYLISRYTKVAVTTSERNEQKTTKALTDHFPITKPGNILNADILRIGMVDNFMIFGIRKLKVRKFRKKKTRIIETAILANMVKNYSETT